MHRLATIHNVTDNRQ